MQLGALVGGVEGGEVTFELGPQPSWAILTRCVIMRPAPSEPGRQHACVRWVSLADTRLPSPVLCEAEAAVWPGAEGPSGRRA